MAELQMLSEEKGELLLEGFQVADSLLPKRLFNKLATLLNSDDYDLVNRRGYKYEQDNISGEFVILSNKEESLQFVYTKTNGEEKIYGSAVVEEGAKKVVKGYEVVDGSFVKTKEFEVTDEVLNQVKESKNNQFPNDREELTAQATCIYGKWCGPGCSGPGTPISKVDSCCKQHDGCYAKQGYFSCTCDFQLQYCLLPYIQLGSEWAIAVSTWFDLQPCRH